jgi:hypothetical protein
MGVTTAMTSTEVWSALDGMFASPTRAHTVNIHIALATTKKGIVTMSEYFSKMKTHTDEMASSGQPLSDEEFVAYILIGLDEKRYNALVSSIVTRVKPIKPSELYSQMLNYEQRIANQYGDAFSPSPSANAASRGHGPGRGFSHGRGRSRDGGHGPLSTSYSGYNNNARHGPSSSSYQSGGQNHPRCQVCYKVSHTVENCWYWCDEDFVLDNRMSGMASTSQGTDPNWYLDSGATDHITGELERLITHDRYNGGEHIRAANGQGMDIEHIGNLVISTSICSLHLNNILHVPRTHKQLISIHHFTLDNNIFVELNPFFFLVKDQISKRVLLHGPCKGGIYPLHKL